MASIVLRTASRVKIWAWLNPVSKIEYTNIAIVFFIKTVLIPYSFHIRFSGIPVSNGMKYQAVQIGLIVEKIKQAPVRL